MDSRDRTTHLLQRACQARCALALAVWRSRCTPHRFQPTPQRGANCREAAITNVLRLGPQREWQRHQLAPLMHALLSDHGVAPARGLPNASVVWTMCMEGGECLMTRAVEHVAHHCVAILASKEQLPLLEQALGCHPAEALARDTATPGWLYFSQGHCMSAVRHKDGSWWDVRQTTPRRIVGDTARAFRQRMASHKGFVVVWSLSHAASSGMLTALARHMTHGAPDAVRATLMLALRIGARACTRWCCTPSVPMDTEDVGLWHMARAQPPPLWPPALVARLASVASTWLRHAVRAHTVCDAHACS